MRREYTVVNDVAATASMKYLRNVIVLPSRCRVVARARTAGSAESLLTSSSKSFGNDVSDDSQRGRRFDSGSRRIAGLDWASPKLVTLRCDAGAMDIFASLGFVPSHGTAGGLFERDDTLSEALA